MGLEEILNALQKRVDETEAQKGTASVSDVVAHWQAVVGDGDDNLEDSCADCQDVFSFGDEIHCSCGALVCDGCYEKYGHAEHDTNPSNAWLRQAIADAEAYLAEV